MIENLIEFEPSDDALLNIYEYSSDFIDREIYVFENGEVLEKPIMSCSKPYQKGNVCSSMETLPNAQAAINKVSHDEPYKSFLMEGSSEVKKKINNLVIDQDVDLCVTYGSSIFQEPQNQEKMFTDVLEFVKQSSSRVTNDDAVEIATFIREQMNKYLSAIDGENIIIISRSRIAFSNEMKNDVDWHIDIDSQYSYDLMEYFTDLESGNNPEIDVNEQIQKLSLQSEKSELNENILGILNVKGASTEFYDYDEELRDAHVKSYLDDESSFRIAKRGYNYDIYIDSDKIISADKDRGVVFFQGFKFGAVHSSPRDISESRMLFILTKETKEIASFFCSLV